MKIFLKLFIYLILFQIVCSCKTGRSRKNRPKLYGGYEASNNEFPHQVGVAFNLFGYTEVICSGSLLTTRLIITAAHCLDTYNPILNLFAIVGTKDLNANEGGWYKINDIIKYPKWTKKRLQYDVILLKSEEPIELKAGLVESIKLPERDTFIPRVDERLWTCGWGLITRDERAEQLKKLDLYVVSEEKCKDIWGSTSDKRICVVSKRKGWGTCNGDSGGGLVYNQRLIGILSYGTEECDSNEPEVYSDLHAYLDWIDDVLKEKTIGYINV